VFRLSFLRGLQHGAATILAGESITMLLVCRLRTARERVLGDAMMEPDDLRVRCLVPLGVLALLIFAAEAANGEPTTVTYQVSASTDDSYSSMQLEFTGSRCLRVGYWDSEPPPYTMFAARFRNVDVPQGAFIVDARLKIRGYSDGSQVLYGVIQAEDADNPAGFAVRFIAHIVKTTAAVNWDPVESWDSAVWYTSPDISTVVQEVVDRPGWLAGNAMVITFSNRMSAGGYRQVCAYDLPAYTSGPKLQITFAEPPTGDFEPDGDVDFADYATLISAWETEEGGPGWNPACDIHPDGFIDMLDLDVFADNWLASIW